MHLTINTDGGGQPGTDVGGPVAAAYVVSVDGVIIGSQSKRFRGTNNDGEYNAVIMAVEALRDEVFAVKSEVKSVKVISDSQLIVYQLNGIYRCKQVQLQEYRDYIRSVIRTLPFPVRFEWKRREFNKDADQLCTATMVHGDKTDFLAPIPPRPTEAAIRRSRDELNGKQPKLESIGSSPDY